MNTFIKTPNDPRESITPNDFTLEKTMICKYLDSGYYSFAYI